MNRIFFYSVGTQIHKISHVYSVLEAGNIASIILLWNSRRGDSHRVNVSDVKVSRYHDVSEVRAK